MRSQLSHMTATRTGIGSEYMKIADSRLPSLTEGMGVHRLKRDSFPEHSRMPFQPETKTHETDLKQLRAEGTLKTADSPASGKNSKEYQIKASPGTHSQSVVILKFVKLQLRAPQGATVVTMNQNRRLKWTPRPSNSLPR
jgi:hypothetical protein